MQYVKEYSSYKPLTNKHNAKNFKKEKIMVHCVQKSFEILMASYPIIQLYGVEVKNMWLLYMKFKICDLCY